MLNLARVRDLIHVHINPNLRMSTLPPYFPIPVPIPTPPFIVTLAHVRDILRVRVNLNLDRNTCSRYAYWPL